MAFRSVEDGVVVQGLREMQRALKRAESDIGPQLKKRLKEAGADIVAPAARAAAPRGKRAHAGPRLADSIKTGVTQRGAWVASSVVYGGVQNYGGRVGRNHATVLTRTSVSQYMTGAVRSTREPVGRHVEEILDWLARELDR